MRQPGPAVSLRPVHSEDLPTFHGHRGGEIAIVAPANRGSQRVLEKCGFIITGSAVAADGVTEITLNRLA